MVPGSCSESRETKVVMMQRVISYIAFMENTIKLLCHQMAIEPRPQWVLLTENLSKYYRAFYKSIQETGMGQDEDFIASDNLTISMNNEDSSCSGMGHSFRTLKVSSPTIDSTTDSVVLVDTEHLGSDLGIFSQETTNPSPGYLFGDDYKVSGDSALFFSSPVDENVSAVLEISSTQESGDHLAEVDGVGNQKKLTEGIMPMSNAASFLHLAQPFAQLSSFKPPVTSFYTVKKYEPEPDLEPGNIRRNKRKQISPKRTSRDDYYLSDRAYLPSWSKGVGSSDTTSSTAQRLHEFPYNIRCNNRHAVHRLQATRNKTVQNTDVQNICVQNTCVPLSAKAPKASVTAPKSDEKLRTKLDLRKASWMNGFMMFSRMNRRKFIDAHPGVHTSHISKIMGYAWRNMNREEQTPYKEKAKLCSQELYRTYASQPQFEPCSTMTSAAATPVNIEIEVPMSSSASQEESSDFTKSA